VSISCQGKTRKGWVQYFIYLVCRLQNGDVDLVSVKTVENFEVIEIMGGGGGGGYLYPSLLGIYWAYEKFSIIDLKKEIMTFESDGLKFAQPLDLYQGPRYSDPVDESMEHDVMDQLYTMTTGNRADYINPTVDGSISCRHIHYVDEDSEAT
jgi:hypothetical protein